MAAFYSAYKQDFEEDAGDVDEDVIVEIVDEGDLRSTVPAEIIHGMR